MTTESSLAALSLAAAIAATFVGSGAAPLDAAEPVRSRFVAQLADGRRLEGQRLQGWERRGGEPTLDDAPLLGPQSPLRWLIDRRNTPPVAGRRGPHLEMWQGDVLPGEVLEFAPASSLPAAPGHLLVAVAAELQPPPTVSPLPARVDAAWVRRIVLAPSQQGPLAPGMLRHRDGRTVPFRAIRFEPQQAVALTAGGRHVAAWSDLAELHLPPPDSLWQLQLRHRAALAPAGESRLLELETSDHLRLTTSLARLEHRALPGSQDSDSWVHGVQPAWSLDALWVPARNVWLRLSYAVHEFPLSRLEPREFRHRPLVGAERQWRRDRSVGGAPLLAASQPSAWGIGVHSASSIGYDLPPEATRLELRVALDPTAGGGGCVRGRILLDDRVVAETPHLVGSQQVAPLAADLTAGETPRQRRLTLQIDPAHESRPPGADPLDIRDQTNWLEPLVTCDERQIRGRLAELAPQSVAAWEGWRVWSPDEYQWETSWDPLAAAPGAFVTRLLTDGDLLLHQRLRRRSGQRYLLLALSKSDADGAAVAEVHAGGRLLRRADVPERSQRRPEAPLIVARIDDLPVGEETDVTVAVSATTPVSLRWDALDAVPTHPEFERLYDDQPHPQAVEDRARSYAGRRCLRLTPETPFRVTFPQPMQFRYRPGPHQCRYARLAVASPSGSRLAIAVKTRGQPRPWLYDLGQGPLTEGRAKRIHSQPLSDDWASVVRDVSGDLKETDVEYIEFFVPDPDGVVLLDQALIGRDGSAWSDLPKPLQAPWSDARQLQARAEVVRNNAGPAVVGIVYPDGRTAEGVFVDDQHVLTLGETMPRQGAARLTLADGRQAEGKLLGVARDRNWGLIRWAGAEPPAAPQRHEHTNVLFDLPFFEAGPGGRELVGFQVEPLPSGQLRWLAPPPDAAAPLGRPLVDASIRVVGLRASTDQPRYVRLLDFTAAVQQLRQGERAGKWPYGQGPAIGLDVRWSAGGAELTRAGRQAQAAGLQAGDVLLEVAGRPVRDPWSLHRAVADRDPGQEVAAKYLRGRQARDVTLRLGYR